MPSYLFDTNHLTLFEQCHPALMVRFLANRPGEVGVGIVSVQEVLKGRLAALSTARKPNDFIRGYELLQESLDAIAQLPLVQFDAVAEGAFQHVRALRPRIGSQDQRIAAIALANGLALLTRNTRHFTGIPGLALADWSV